MYTSLIGNQTMVSFEIEDNITYPMNTNTTNIVDTNFNYTYDNNNYSSAKTIIIIVQISLYMCFVFIMMFLITYIMSVNLVRSMMRDQTYR